MSQGRARGRYYTKAEVNHIIKRIEDNGDRFREYVDKDIDRTRFNETRSEDRIWDQVKQLEEATDMLRRKFDKSDRWQETRGEVQVVLREARDVERVMERIQISPRVRDTWRLIRHDLNTLSGVYNLGTVG
jgi:hypothetical protein